MKVELKGVMCIHNVQHLGQYGRATRSVVFIKPDSLESYIWVTTAGQEYKECQMYDISAEHEGRGILKRVKLLKKLPATDSAPVAGESEQPDHTPVDIFDLIYGIDTPLTND